MLDTSKFVDLSVALTGVQDLDPQLVQAYLDRMVAQFGAAEVSMLLNEFASVVTQSGRDEASNQQALGQRIVGNPAFAPLAEQIIYLWYVSAMYLPDPGNPARERWVYGSAEHYDRALIWRVIGGHAPMTPGRNGSFWAEPPAPGAA